MESQLKRPVEYHLSLDDSLINMNNLIGHYIVLEWAGEIRCIVCGRKTNRSFFQGLCYPCFLNAPEASECILRPELCRAHLGESRDMAWSELHCLQEHIVYLALTSHVKVGVTRSSQIPTRWIDQGAWKTITIAKTHNRTTAGQIEVALKKHTPDKTFWQRMLKNVCASDIDLTFKKRELAAKLPPKFRNFITRDSDVTEILYPVSEYPTKIKSTGFDKCSEIAGLLSGIRGQYLYFDDNRVLNLRKHQGYIISLEY
ncbi:MAG: DUF2797 domain-containing protein [FCB group bacterium]|nr:DUF2797 domain-containing protein [FCB group bacterium]